MAPSPRAFLPAWAAAALAVTLLACGGGSGGVGSSSADAPLGAGATASNPAASGPNGNVASSSGDVEGCQCQAGANAIRMPLSCFCATAPHAALCGLNLASIEPTTPEICPTDGLAILRKTGCGRVSYELADPAFEVSSPIFDQVTGNLVGVYSGSDIPIEACGVWQVLYGRGMFETRFNSSLISVADVCPHIESCTFCGQSTTPGAPPPCS